MRRVITGARRATDRLTNRGGARIERHLGKVDKQIAALRRGIDESAERDAQLLAQLDDITLERNRLRAGRVKAAKLVGLLEAHS